jgi:hypothetical protein
MHSDEAGKPMLSPMISFVAIIISTGYTTLQSHSLTYVTPYGSRIAQIASLDQRVNEK